MLQLGVYYLCIKVIDSEMVRDRASIYCQRRVLAIEEKEEEKEKETLARKNKFSICSGTKEKEKK